MTLLALVYVYRMATFMDKGALQDRIKVQGELVRQMKKEIKPKEEVGTEL